MASGVKIYSIEVCYEGDCNVLRRIDKSSADSKRAFTLVELIVVLVILAVIAAMLVPALTGYIKRSKKEKYTETVHYALTAAQSVMVEYYGTGHIAQAGIANQTGQTGGGGSGGDQRWDIGKGAKNEDWQREWGERVLALMDRDRTNEPYLFIFGCGRPDSGLDESQLYTVYYVAYVEDENSPAVFYLNGTWRYTYPTASPAAIVKHGKVNYLVTPNGEIPLQLYVVSNRTNIADNFWTSNNRNSLWGHSESSGYYRW